MVRDMKRDPILPLNGLFLQIGEEGATEHLYQCGLVDSLCVTNGNSLLSFITLQAEEKKNY